MIELKKCSKCGNHLIPLGTILYHPHNPECPYNDLTKSIELHITIMDEGLYYSYEKTFGKPTYTIEEVMQSHDLLKAELEEIKKRRKDNLFLVFFHKILSHIKNKLTHQSH